MKSRKVKGARGQEVPGNSRQEGGVGPEYLTPSPLT